MKPGDKVTVMIDIPFFKGLKAIVDQINPRTGIITAFSGKKTIRGDKKHFKLIKE